MVDRLGTLIGFIIGVALIGFGIAWPEDLSNYYLHKTSQFEQNLTELRAKGAPRPEIVKAEEAIKEFKRSWVANISRFLDLKSILIVLGGAYAATLIAFPFRRAIRTVVYVAMVFARERREQEFETVYRSILEFADYRYRNELIPDAKVSAIPLYFLRDAIENFVQVDWVSEEMVHEIISSEIEGYAYEQDQEIGVMEYMGRVAPAFGLIGTVVGLILLMGAAAEEGATIGGIVGSMSVALTTTLYGMLLAQLIFLPVGAKLTRTKETYIRLYEMVLEGTIYLHRRERPDVIEHDMQIYLSKKRRMQIRTERRTALSRGELQL